MNEEKRYKALINFKKQLRLIITLFILILSSIGLAYYISYCRVVVQ